MDLIGHGGDVDDAVLRLFSHGLADGEVVDPVLSAGTCDTYLRHVRLFLQWLGDNSLVTDVQHPTHRVAFADEAGRARAVGGYRAVMMIEHNLADATVRGMLRAVDLFYYWLGFQRRLRVPRTASTQTELEALDRRQHSMVTRSAAARSERDIAVAALILDIEPTTSDVVGYRCSDLRLDPKSHTGAIGSRGTDDETCWKTLRPGTVAVLDRWLLKRRELLGDQQTEALFLNLKQVSGPLTERGLNYVIYRIGMQVDMVISPRTLRNTAKLRMPNTELESPDLAELLSPLATVSDVIEVEPSAAEPVMRRQWRHTRPPRSPGAQLRLDFRSESS
ncbi:hypothetical protein [Nocardia tengchongensis]|uniref:hypothetical protein n=1 Tax=Nocardia tengchongensis TaxID=2055889 RepID=UPI00361EE472